MNCYFSTEGDLHLVPGFWVFCGRVVFSWMGLGNIKRKLLEPKGSSETKILLVELTEVVVTLNNKFYL